MKFVRQCTEVLDILSTYHTYLYVLDGKRVEETVVKVKIDNLRFYFRFLIILCLLSRFRVRIYFAMIIWNL